MKTLGQEYTQQLIIKWLIEDAINAGRNRFESELVTVYTNNLDTIWTISSKPDAQYGIYPDYPLVTKSSYYNDNSEGYLNWKETPIDITSREDKIPTKKEVEKEGEIVNLMADIAVTNQNGSLEALIFIDYIPMCSVQSIVNMLNYLDDEVYLASSLLILNSEYKYTRKFKKLSRLSTTEILGSQITLKTGVSNV